VIGNVPNAVTVWSVGLKYPTPPHPPTPPANHKLPSLRTWRPGPTEVGERDLSDRLANRVQLTTDGLRVYLEAVEAAFGCDIDYATLVKVYGTPQDSTQPETRYSPAVCLGATATTITGNPDRRHISTSYVERSNLTMRMRMRRFTRLTNGFSKKVDNLRHAVALYAVHYNFCRVHQTLRVTPAMEAGLTGHIWDIAEIIRLAYAPASRVA